MAGEHVLLDHHPAGIADVPKGIQHAGEVDRARSQLAEHALPDSLGA